MPSLYFNNKKGFTLIELLVVIAIMGVIATVVFISLQQAREKGKVAQATLNGDAFKQAVLLYQLRMGFYPPDTSRGQDPGLMKALPWDPDTGNDITPPSCSWCPPNWQTIVNQTWDGPYMNSWPKTTPWGGKYDYNYWSTGTTRYGCNVPPGIYIGIERAVGDATGAISAFAEQQMINQKLDADNCINSEVQFLLFKL